MDQNGGSNQNLAHNNLCRSGCGFYGNSAFEGMCSKCYKDSVQRRNQNPSPIQVQGRTTPTTAVSAAAAVANSLTSLPSDSMSSSSPVTSVETASPTVPTVSTSQEKEDSDIKGAEGSDSAASMSEDSSSDDKDKKTPKKNRCYTCKKKVGLTGFTCRCGGLYCGIHRYSDKHNCTFDYKELAQQQIRKANPLIVGEKINKI